MASQHVPHDEASNDLCHLGWDWVVCPLSAWCISASCIECVGLKSNCRQQQCSHAKS